MIRAFVPSPTVSSTSKTAASSAKSAAAPPDWRRPSSCASELKAVPGAQFLEYGAIDAVNAAQIVDVREFFLSAARHDRIHDLIAYLQRRSQFFRRRRVRVDDGQ